MKKVSIHAKCRRNQSRIVSDIYRACRRAWNNYCKSLYSEGLTGKNTLKLHQKMIEAFADRYHISK